VSYDLIGWDADVICFVSVKTRTTRDLKTPDAALDRPKRREVARQFLRRFHLRSNRDSIE
jgi:putative endonuclease